MIFFLDHRHDPAFNLALEELLCTEYPEEFLMLWRNTPVIVAGRNQNTLAEVNSAFVYQEKIPVIRRMTGGGAVYHDLGNVNYSIVIHRRSPEPDSFARFARPVVEALKQLGVPAGFTGRNDIVAEGRKVSGSAQTCIGDRTLFHGTLLFDTDFDRLEKALNPGRAKIVSKGIKSVRARVRNLKDFLPELSVEEFIRKLSAALSSGLDCGSPQEIPPEYAEKAELLAQRKYRNPEWNGNAAFVCDCSDSIRCAGGEVKVELKLSAGKIAELRFSGDFFGSRDPAELAEKLLGLPLRRECVEEALKTINIHTYIQGITPGELAGVICMGGNQ